MSITWLMSMQNADAFKCPWWLAYFEMNNIFVNTKCKLKSWFVWLVCKSWICQTNFQKSLPLYTFLFQKWKGTKRSDSLMSSPQSVWKTKCKFFMSVCECFSFENRIQSHNFKCPHYRTKLSLIWKADYLNNVEIKCLLSLRFFKVTAAKVLSCWLVRPSDAQ